MRKTVSNVIFGLLLIFIGVAYGGDALGFWHFQLFFRGWWTLFIIIPCLYSIIRHKPNPGNLLGLAVGVLLLLGAQRVISWPDLGRLILPLIIVAIGLSLIFTARTRGTGTHASINSDGLPVYDITFSEQLLKPDGEEFKGCVVNCCFASFKLDLTTANLSGDVAIVIKNTFGGGKVILPPGVQLSLSPKAVFGEVCNKYNTANGGKKVVIDVNCVFGGVDIK